MTWINTEERLPEITINQALRYEIAGSWWSKLITNDFLQEMAGNYFSWKVRRKYLRYVEYQSIREKMDALTGGVGE